MSLPGLVVPGNGVATGQRVTAATPVIDSANVSYSTSFLITPGVTFPTGRSIGMVITSSGTVTLTLSGDSSQIPIPVTANSGFQTFPFACSNLTLSGGAAGTFWCLP